MKEELDKKLCEKYPEIFKNRWITTLCPTCKDKKEKETVLPNDSNNT